MHNTTEQAVAGKLGTRQVAGSDVRFHPVVNRAPRTLSPGQIDAFNQHGFIQPLDALGSTEAHAARRYFDGLLAQVTPQDGGRDAYSINGYQTRCAGIWDLATHPRILDYVEDLIGTDIVCWGTHYFCKLAGESKRVPWHQDASYWPFRPTRTVTVWLAIDDVTETNAPMVFLPGSHHHGHLRWQPADGDVVLHQEIPDVDDSAGSFANTMRSGQMSVHADTLVHGSAPNTSGRRRCGLTMRYVPPRCWVNDERKLGWTASAILCRGSDPTGRWPVNTRPRGDDLRSRER